MPSTADEVEIASFDSEPIARMWAEALSREGVPVLVKSKGMGSAEWGSVVNQPHTLYVLPQEEERARALVPQEHQVWPLRGERARSHVGLRPLVYVVCLALMGILLWVALAR